MAKVMPVYVEEALTGSMELNPEQRGIYWSLLFKIWSCAGVLKDDNAIVSRTIGVNPKVYNRVRKELLELGKIEIEDDLIINRKLVQTLFKVSSKSVQMRDLAISRHAKSLKTNNVDVDSAHAIEDRKIKDTKRVSKTAKYQVDFDRWYDAYPNKKGRANAFKKYITVCESGVEAVTLITAVKAYAESLNGTEKRYIKHPATCHNAESWLDDLDTGPASELHKEGPLSPVTL